MRTPLPLFVISALLFIFGVGFVVVAARGRRVAAQPVVARADTAPIATTRQIMTAIVSPTSNAIFQAVQTNVTLKGVEEIFPRTDEEWAMLGAQAASLAEAGHLLMA